MGVVACSIKANESQIFSVVCVAFRRVRSCEWHLNNEKEPIVLDFKMRNFVCFEFDI